MKRRATSKRDAYGSSGSGERGLWASVVLVAFADACSKSKSASGKAERRRARLWLTGNSPDFALVCESAGMDAGRVRGRALEIEARGWTFYNPYQIKRR